MNQLETLIIPTETVEFGDQSFELRGLALPDITFIVRHHRATLSRLYTEAIEGKLEGSVNEIAMSMLDDFAPLAGMVIACAMDSPGHADKVMKLPLAFQADALEKIVRLTLVGENALEKLMEIVVRAVQGTAVLTSPRT